MKNLHNPLIAIAVLVASCGTPLAACGTLKQVGRTINDAASVLCELAAVDMGGEEALGVSPAEYCAIHDNLRPFIDEALRAKNAAAMSMQRGGR